MKGRLMRVFAVCSLAILMLFSFVGSAAAASSQFITKGSTSSKVVALTFDDGSDGTNIGKLLQILSDHNVRATFFLTGSGAMDHPQSIRNIASKGHQLGNHSYSHPDFTKLTASQIKSELDRTESVIRNLTGRSTKPIFRAPFGAVNSAALRAIGDAGYTHTIQWDIDTVDWRGVSADQIVTKVMSNVKPGSIILMHTGAGASGTPGALPVMISKLKAQGYKFVTVSEMLNLPTGTPPSTVKTYTVQAGDTLYSIALRFNVTVEQLAAANGITDPSLIRVGQVLIIPGQSGFQDVSAFYAPAVNYLVKNGVSNGISSTAFGTYQPIKRVDAAVWMAKILKLDTVSAPPSGFTDVPARAAGAVNALKEEGIMNGKTSARFDSSGYLTRGETALVLQRAYDLAGSSSASSFADVSVRYEAAVDALVANGVTNGISATHFGTDRDVTRGQLAVFLYRINN
ncbi:polysaccharide deacetylase family protein [Indiicoccus explosivorum]|uniref:polysaccharide deacetylase family protein n=1 Tax=Indiicoccus explosivorum TaxID=1917864 RepID=UPI000B44AE45|nr:polysaccharide deacetylase family protein [Indiicoccus explosivorum]